MKIEFYMLIPLLVSIYSLRLFLTRRKSTEPVHKISTPIDLMLSILGIAVFLFMIFND